MPWAFVVLLAAICLWLFQLCLTLRAQTTLLQQQLELNDIELRSLRQHLEAERILSRHLTAPPVRETPPPTR